MKKVVILHEIVSPYRAPLFKALADQEGIELVVLLLAESEARRDWTVDLEALPYPWRMLRSSRVETGRSERSTWFLPRGLTEQLQQLDPDVIVLGGWGNVAVWQALGWARRRGKKIVMWSESTAERRTGYVRTIKSAGVRRMLRRCQAFVVPGRAAERHLLSLGAYTDAIFIAPNAIDLTLFTPAPQGITAERRLLFVGQLVPRKGCDRLLQALAVADPSRECSLSIVGTGPEEETLRDLAPQLGLNVDFLGHLEYDQMPKLYRRFSGFVMPSLHDIWGFVLQEAAASGLPLIASDRVGAVADLLEGRGAGWITEPTVASLADAIRQWRLTPFAELWQMGGLARKAAQQLSVDRAVEGFMQAVDLAMRDSAH